MWKRWL